MPEIREKPAALLTNSSFLQILCKDIMEHIF